jgi:hypothetical protein
MQLDRKILMLYPDAKDISDVAERKKLFQLIDSMSFIVDEANRIVQEFIRKNYSNFKKHCLTEIILKSLTQYYKDPTTNQPFESIVCNGLRICLTRFADYNFADYYDNALSIVKKEERDISHLVAIQMTEEKTFWRAANKQEEAIFDATVETNMDDLLRVLVSIMIDILLYHSFSLPEKYETRKLFPTLKRSYILNKFSNDDIHITYGNSRKDLEEIGYIPISLNYISGDTLRIDADQLFYRFGDLILSELVPEITEPTLTVKTNALYSNDYAYMISQNHDRIKEQINDFKAKHTNKDHTYTCFQVRKTSGREECIYVCEKDFASVFAKSFNEGSLYFLKVVL